MPIVKYIKGDLLETDLMNIAHGCNAQGVMGSGVAKAVRAKYPEVFKAYKAVYDRSGLFVGEVVYVETHDGKTIHNMITQENYGRTPGFKFVSYDGIYTCFKYLNADVSLREEGMIDLAIPKIGSQLGGGNWDAIKAIIDSVTPDIDIIVYSID